ncbi:hypothetical protein BDV93DRAFT_46188 [Ceratobasidium sp. AG-I]|nr:hypothetical protein BDV93DRAFT_46188 [Ceratobasidium sp. AG-I]
MDHGRHPGYPVGWWQQADRASLSLSTQDSSSHISSSNTGSPSTNSSSSSAPACQFCFDHKRGCRRPVGQPDHACYRCRWNSRPCIARPRAERANQRAANQPTEDQLKDELASTDQEIDNIIQRYTGVLPSHAQGHRRKKSQEIQEILDQLANIPSYIPTDRVRAEFVQLADPADGKYWQEGPSSNLLLRGLINERHHVPDILLNRILGPQDANNLFDRFMKLWNHGLDLLDPAIHSPRTVLQRCPLLFTIVLAIASRDYQGRPDLHERLLKQAKLSAAAALTDGIRTADTVQALLLIASYPPAVRRFSEDRTSLYITMAIRMATELKLENASRTVPENNREKLELDNHTRTWNACLLLDSTSSVKVGRTPTLRNSGNVVHTSDPRETQTGFEIRIFRAVNRFMQMAKGGNSAFDYSTLMSDFTEDMRGLDDQIHFEHQRARDRNEHTGQLRQAILLQTMDYARMVVYSFGFTKAIAQGNNRGGQYLTYCFKVASSAVIGVLDRLAPLTLFKYSPDAWFEYAAFSAAFLIKLLRPQFAADIDISSRQRIVDLVKRLIDMYRSPYVALPSDKHVPRVLAQFLENAIRAVPDYIELVRRSGSSSASSSSRGLSRSPPKTPSPPHGSPKSGFDAAPSEALMAALAGYIPEWWELVDHALPGMDYGPY